MSRTAPRTQATVKLLNLIDTECGASLRAESAAVAVSIARELSEGMTRAERIATHEFLTDVAAPRDGRRRSSCLGIPGAPRSGRATTAESVPA